MQITRSSIDTNRGPAEWFTGAVFIDPLAAPVGQSRLSASAVHFTPGARTAWHTHPFGQTIYVTEGIGRCQRRGGPVEVIRPGDRVYFEPGEDHWHGAAPDRFMTHFAMQEVDDGGTRDQRNGKQQARRVETTVAQLADDEQDQDCVDDVAGRIHDDRVARRRAPRVGAEVGLSRQPEG